MMAKFLRDERGASAVEFALLVPILLMVLMGTVTLFDLFRTMQSVEKATFTVGDMLSRQSVVNEATLERMLSLMRHSVPSASDGGLRVSSIANIGGAMQIIWSRTKGASVPQTAVRLDNLPSIPPGDSIVLTESFVPHQAAFSGFGLDAITFGAQAAHRPRFVSRITYQ